MPSIGDEYQVFGTDTIFQIVGEHDAGNWGLIVRAQSGGSIRGVTIGKLSLAEAIGTGYLLVPHVNPAA